MSERWSHVNHHIHFYIEAGANGKTGRLKCEICSCEWYAIHSIRFCFVKYIFGHPRYHTSSIVRALINSTSNAQIIPRT